MSENNNTKLEKKSTLKIITQLKIERKGQGEYKLINYT